MVEIRRNPDVPADFVRKEGEASACRLGIEHDKLCGPAHDDAAFCGLAGKTPNLKAFVGLLPIQVADSSFGFVFSWLRYPIDANIGTERMIRGISELAAR